MPRFSRLFWATLVFCVASSFGQTLPRWTYNSGGSKTGTSAKVTLQLPSNATRKARPLVVTVSCASACSVVFSRNGTTATATAATVVKNRTQNPTAQTEVYTDSDSTGGTAYPAVPHPGGLQTFDLTDMEFRAGENLSIAVTSGGSQAISILPKWEEY